MQMNDSQRIPATKDKVWAALNDPAVLKQCIPGCQSLEMTSGRIESILRFSVIPGPPFRRPGMTAEYPDFQHVFSSLGQEPGRMREGVGRIGEMLTPSRFAALWLRAIRVARARARC
jgi:hypothetical protein